MTKHTPGPWKSRASDPQEGSECYWLGGGPEPHKEIGTIYGPQHGEQAANARLAAASPDLLRVVQLVLADVTYRTPAGTTNCRFCDNNLDRAGNFRDMHASDCVYHELRSARGKATDGMAA